LSIRVKFRDVLVHRYCFGLHTVLPFVYGIGVDSNVESLASGL
jgi:hypothetical protein